MFDFPEIGLCQFQDYLKFNKCPFPNQTIFTFLTFWETILGPFGAIRDLKGPQQLKVGKKCMEHIHL